MPIPIRDCRRESIHSLGMQTFVNSLRTLYRALLGHRTAVPGPVIRPAAPDGCIIYAIGDIHGERALLARMLEAIRFDAAAQGPALSGIAVFLGDYVDRGPDSRGVIETLIGDPLPGFTTHCLMGNHEQAMLSFLQAPADGPEWLTFGGVQTLQSYGIRASVGVVDAERCRGLRDQLAAALPAQHRAFLEGLKPMLSLGDYVFVHAGVRADRGLDEQTLDDMLWIREPFLRHRASFGKTVVHGHTVVTEVEVHGNRIAVDTGAYATGRLSAVALAGHDVRVLSVT